MGDGREGKGSTGKPQVTRAGCVERGHRDRGCPRPSFAVIATPLSLSPEEQVLQRVTRALALSPPPPLQDSLRFLKLAVRARPAAETQDAGYKFCKGLFHRFNNEP